MIFALVAGQPGGLSQSETGHIVERPSRGRLQEVMAAVGDLREHRPKSDDSAGDGVGVEHKRDGDKGGELHEERPRLIA